MSRYSKLTNYIQELCIEICFVMNLKFSYFWGCWYLLRTNKLHFLIKNYFNSKTSKISYEHQGVSNEHFEVNYFIVCNKRLFLKYFEVCSFEGDLPPYFFLWVKGKDINQRTHKWDRKPSQVLKEYKNWTANNYVIQCFSTFFKSRNLSNNIEHLMEHRYSK